MIDNQFGDNLYPAAVGLADKGSEISKTAVAGMYASIIRNIVAFIFKR